MSRRTIAIAAALSVLAIGSPLVNANANPLATEYLIQGVEKYEVGNYQGAIADYNKAISINPQNAVAYANRSILKKKQGDLDGSCSDGKKAASLGNNQNVRWLNSNNGAWCRNMQ